MVPVIHGEGAAAKTPFSGFEMQLMVDRADGSQAITVISEILHVGGKIPIHRQTVNVARVMR